MYRYKVVGSTRMESPHRPARSILIVYVTARSRDEALDMAFDDMGLMAVASVRRIGKQLKG